jgi:hypothetical protein
MQELDISVARGIRIVTGIDVLEMQMQIFYFYFFSVSLWGLYAIGTGMFTSADRAMQLGLFQVAHAWLLDLQSRREEPPVCISVTRVCVQSGGYLGRTILCWSL